jgi:hypothetical protein
MLLLSGKEAKIKSADPNVGTPARKTRALKKSQPGRLSRRKRQAGHGGCFYDEACQEQAVDLGAQRGLAESGENRPAAAARYFAVFIT